MSHQAFDEALYAQLQEAPNSLKKRRLLNVLELPENNPRRQRMLARMEVSVREHFGLTGDVDWSAPGIDLNELLKLIMTLLPLLLLLFG